MAVFDTLAWRQHNLELDETTQALDLIEVYACPPHEKHFAPFCDIAANHENAAERADERRRVLANDPRVDRFLWPGLVAALVGNELTGAIRTRTDLEPALRHDEEGVGLIDDLAGSRRERDHLRSNPGKVLNPRLDFDVAGQPYGSDLS